MRLEVAMAHVKRLKLHIFSHVQEEKEASGRILSFRRNSSFKPITRNVDGTY